jgi:hypothetical protein
VRHDFAPCFVDIGHDFRESVIVDGQRRKGQQEGDDDCAGGTGVESARAVVLTTLTTRAVKKELDRELEHRMGMERRDRRRSKTISSIILFNLLICCSP